MFNCTLPYALVRFMMHVVSSCHEIGLLGSSECRVQLCVLTWLCGSWTKVCKSLSVMCSKQ